MIRILSAGYQKSDYRLLMYALTAGMTEMKKSSSCHGHCEECYCEKACRSLQSAINYLNKKI